MWGVFWGCAVNGSALDLRDNFKEIIDPGGIYWRRLLQIPMENLFACVVLVV